MQASDPIDRDFERFSYRPVPLLAIVGMIIGVLSVLAFLGVVGIVLACLGVVTSLAATLRIAFDRENFSGLKIAGSGLALSTVCFAGGVYNQIDLYRRELPPGFQRISFPHDISEKAFVNWNGVTQLHPDVAALEGKPIFFKAWMFPIGQNRGLTQFLVVKDNGLCCFGKQPAPQDSIIVEVDTTAFPNGVDYTTGMVSIAGTFEIIRNEQGYLSSLGENTTCYKVSADYFEKSWTMF